MAHERFAAIVEARRRDEAVVEPNLCAHAIPTSEGGAKSQPARTTVIVALDERAGGLWARRIDRWSRRRLWSGVVLGEEGGDDLPPKCAASRGWRR